MKKRILFIALCLALCVSVAGAVLSQSNLADAVDVASGEVASSEAVSNEAVSNDTAAAFTDIANHWAKASIEAAVQKGWFQGTSTTTFSPNAALSRGMFVTILGRMAGVSTTATDSTFTDVPADAYYAPYVTWAQTNKITNGTTTTTFSPEASITREQLATLLHHFAQLQQATLPSSGNKSFSDAQQISAWATDAVTALAEAGILNGMDDGTFAPKGTATRAQTATMLLRYFDETTPDTPDAPTSDAVTTNGGDTVQIEKLEHVDASAESTVYYTSAISSDALMQIYEKLGRKATGNVAVKLSTGEAGGHHYLDPNLIKALVQSVNGTIVECNTAYGGSRAETALHRQVAQDHGFTAIADVDIMDENGSMSIPVANGKHLTQDLVGANLKNYDFIMVLSHFKGHAMGGFGGALKNISIGIGSSEGKALIHGAGDPSKIWSAEQNSFLESMAEAAKAVSDYEDSGEKMLYISVMNNLSVDCDCDSNPAAPTMKDIGILASTDPVALDQACVDLVYAVPDGADLITRIERQNGSHILEYADEIHMGNRAYKLVDIG